PARHLNPLLVVGTDEVVMATQFLAAVPRSLLAKPAGNLARRSTEIIDALDFLISGV
ncbi:MAG: CcdB family protein, partial [Alphaproteobacteria bacterium]|nr:CcdB family protein [Alphaproteobacteria bacterium]